MGSRVATLGLSLALAGACAVILWQRQLLQQRPASIAATPAPATALTRTLTNYVTNFVTVQNLAPAGTNSGAAATTAGNQFLWRKVETSDYATYIANLRSLGCPEQTVRDIVIADVTKLFATRRAELTTGGKVVPYWESAAPVGPDERAALAQKLQEMDRQKTVLVRDLLGVDLATELRKNREGDVYPDNRLGFLSTDKQDQVSALREAFNEQWAQMNSASYRANRPQNDIAAELQRLDEQRLANLAQILTPEELRTHELQTSWTAINLRERLTGFHPTESEFQSIFDLQKAFDDVYVHYGFGKSDSTAQQQKANARTQLESQIRLTLGEGRYADYLRAQQRSVQR